MYVYNSQRRLINIGAKLPLLPGNNKLTPKQATYLLKFKKVLEPYLTGKDPWLVISEEEIVETSNDTAPDEADAKLKAFVEDNSSMIADVSDGVMPEDEDDIGAKIAARLAGK